MKLQNHDEFLKICDLLDECYYHCERNVPKMGRWKLYCKNCENLHQLQRLGKLVVSKRKRGVKK